MESVKVRHYIQRGTDFLAGMRYIQNEEPYRNSTALLAIHAAISYADALRIGLGDEVLANDDHRKAVAKLQRLLAAKGLDDRTGFQHLEFLISNKSNVTYGNERLKSTISALMALKAERFATWANRLGKQLNIGGWQHDDQ
jgi:enoyl-CoA hydratase/carnithine racemase